MIGRLVLEYCKDVDEAFRFLKELPHRSSFSYILMDKSLITQSLRLHHVLLMSDMIKYVQIISKS